MKMQAKILIIISNINRLTYMHGRENVQSIKSAKVYSMFTVVVLTKTCQSCKKIIQKIKRKLLQAN